MNDTSRFSDSVEVKQLLASSATLAGIIQCINKFWISTEYSVDAATLRITHPSRVVNEKVRVVRKRGRYRFEIMA